MESIGKKEVEGVQTRGTSGPGIPILASLIFGVMLMLDFLFAPALLDFIEAATGKFATLELVIRVYFLLFFFQFLLVIFFLLFVRPVAGLKKRFVLYFLAAEGLILCSIWIFDDPGRYFLSEESALTFFSAIVLTLCSVGAFVNLLLLRFQKDAGRALQVFWGLLSAAFLFAAVDEFFMIHERLARITKASNWGQDLFTAAYIIGACGVLAIFYKSFRNGLFNRKNYFFRLLMAGVTALGLASFFDSFDFLFRFLDRHFHSYFLLNSLEELMEFTATVLFCCAFFVNIFEADNGRILGKAESGMKTPRSRGALRGGFALLVLLSAAGFLGMKFAYGVSDGRIIREGGYRISLFADMDDGLQGPDGLLYHPDFGLLVGNERSGELLVFDRGGQGSIFADSRNGLVSPEGLAAGTKELFVADDSQGVVLKYPAAGADPVVVMSKGLKSPEGLAIDAQGRLYIADEGLSMVIRQVGDRREILASSLDGLMTPEEMAFDEEGNLYVTDEEARSVFKISTEGETTVFADKSTGLVCPEGVTIHEDRIYVTDNRGGIVFRFEADGTGEKFLTFGKRYRSLSGITVDGRGDLYLVVNDTYSRNAYIFKVEPKREDLPITDVKTYDKRGSQQWEKLR